MRKKARIERVHETVKKYPRWGSVVRVRTVEPLKPQYTVAIDAVNAQGGAAY